MKTEESETMETSEALPLSAASIAPEIKQKIEDCFSLHVEKDPECVQMEMEFMAHLNPKMNNDVHQQCLCQIRKFDSQIGEAERLLKLARQAREQVETKTQEKQFIRRRMDYELGQLAYGENYLKWRIANTRRYLEEELYKPYSRSNQRQKEVGMRSSIEELNNLRKKLHNQVLHRGSSLPAEKRLLKEIEQLESAKEKLGRPPPRASHLYSWTNYSLGGSLLKETCTKRRIQIIRCELEKTRENQRAKRDKIKRVKKEMEALETDLVALRKELEKMGRIKNEAHALISTLEEQRAKVRGLLLSEGNCEDQGCFGETNSQLGIDEQNALRLLRVGKFWVESTLEWGVRGTKSHMYQVHHKYRYYRSKPWNGRGTSIYYKRTGNFLPRK